MVLRSQASARGEKTEGIGLKTIASVLPVELLLEERAVRYSIRIGKIAEIGNIGVDTNNLRQGGDGKDFLAVKEIKGEAGRFWKIDFEGADTRRVAFASFPVVLVRLDAKWVVTDHWISQVLTGQGQFGTFLNSIGYLDVPTDCERGTGVDNVEHILLRCPVYEAQRKCIADIIGGRQWPATAQSLVATKETFQAFAIFSRECVWIEYESAKPTEAMNKNA